MTEAMVNAMVGRMVHVGTHGPNGWDGHARSHTGTVLTVTDQRGIRQLVDVSRVSVQAI